MNPKEKAANREAFRKMSLIEKITYIRTYYWMQILLVLIAVIVIGSVIHRQITKKQNILFAAYINLSIGSDLDRVLHEGYLENEGLDPKKTQVLIYRNLYLSENPSAADHEMSYASRLKLLATINGKLLDLVLMNREAYDILSANEYLLDLTELSRLDAALYRELEPLLTDNTVIIEDNMIEVNLNEAENYQAVTKEVKNGIDLSGIPVIAKAGFSDPIYAGIIANTPRLGECADYLGYILSLQQGSI